MRSCFQLGNVLISWEAETEEALMVARARLLHLAQVVVAGRSRLDRCAATSRGVAHRDEGRGVRRAFEWRESLRDAQSGRVYAAAEGISAAGPLRESS